MAVRPQHEVRARKGADENQQARFREMKVREHCAGPAEGHFGLLGISERAKRLNADLTINSEPGAGTLVMVQVALDQSLEPEESVSTNGG